MGNSIKKKILYLRKLYIQVLLALLVYKYQKLYTQ